MKRLFNTDEVKKGDKVFVKEITKMWDSKKEEFYNCCFEYVFEVVRNNQKTLGCKYLNGPHAGSGFNWIKGYPLNNDKKQYYLVDNESEIYEKCYRK